MGVKLDIRTAVGNANAGFRKFPVQFCLPLVVCGGSTSVAELIAHRLLGKSAATWAGLIILVCCLVATYFGELIVATMYVGSREGATPGLEQAKKVREYEGLWWVMWGLFLRYIGWSTIVGMSLFVVAVVGLIGRTVLHIVSTQASGIGAVSGGIPTSAAWAAVFSMVFAVALSRYMFVVPMIAILRGNSGPDIIRDSAKRAKTVRGTAMLLAVAESGPGILIYLVERLVWPGVDAYHGLRAWVGLVVSFLMGCYLAWFLLVRTEAATLLLAQVPLVAQVPGEVPWARPLGGGAGAV